MNQPLVDLIVQTAARTGVSERLITFTFGLGDHGPTWTATITVLLGKGRKPVDPPRTRCFLGSDPDPAKALAEAEQSHLEWKHPEIGAEREKRATLASFAKDDPVLADSLRAKGLID